ncbi:hypothetical protein [Bordetella petrii]|uniref:hypothetical protein n=1 Tax=Bordetella petrii TaxID=94624 RepID=UPI00372D9078
MDVRSLERSGKVAALRGGGQLLLVGPTQVFDGIAPALIIRDASRLRAALYPHLRDDSSLTKLATLYRQLVCTGSVAGHYSPQQTTDQMVTLMQYGHIAAVALPDMSGNDGTGNTQPITPAENPPGPVSQWSLADRFGYVLRHSTEHMSDAMAREVRDKLLDPVTLAAIVGVLVVWAGSHAVGVGFVADAALLAIGFALAGWSIFGGIKYLASFFNLTMNAASERELNEAARQFAEGVTAIGVGALIGLLTRGASRLAPRPVGRSTPRPSEPTSQTPRQAADTTATSTARRAGQVSLPENRAPKIFGSRPGHLPDTPQNRELLLSVANDPTARLGPDRFNTIWSARTLPDGSQVWTQMRNGQLWNGGMNPTPLPFNPETGLASPTRPGWK